MSMKMYRIEVPTGVPPTWVISQREFTARSWVATLVRLTATLGHPPTLRELAQSRGVAKGVAKYWIDVAVGFGLVERLAGSTRALTVVSA